MSHLQTSAVVITDEHLFERIAKSLGLKWHHACKSFKWYADNVGECLHKITYTAPKGKYPALFRNHEVGVVQNPDGPGLVLQFDPYDRHLAELIGRNGEKLMNAYSEAFARQFAERNGFTVNTYIDDEGFKVVEMIEVNQTTY